MKANYRKRIPFFILLMVVCFAVKAADFHALSLEEVRAGAEKGDVEAQREMGWRYYNGQGVPRDYEEAGKWYDKAAKRKQPSGAEAITAISAATNPTPTTFVPDEPPFVPLYFDTTDFEKAHPGRFGKDDEIVQFPSAPSPQSPGNRPVPKQKTRGLTDEEIGLRDSGPSFTPSVSGTGFFITEDGFLITSAHVIRDANQIQVTHKGTRFPAKVIKVDAANDLALLKVEGKFSAIPVASSRGTGLGASVFIVGFPNVTLQGFAPKFAKGEIASLSGAQDDPRYFQISVPVQPGNSGGALIDQHGNAVGVVAAKLDSLVALVGSGAIPENVNYAVKSSFLLSFLEALPDVAAKLKEPNAKDQKFEDAVRSAELAAVLILCRESPKLPNFSRTPTAPPGVVLEQPNAPSNPLMRATPEPRYVGDHYVESILDDGNYIKMEDGSLWEVSPLDSASSGVWTESSEITVIRVDNSSYPYKLLNTDDNEAVRARPVR